MKTLMNLILSGALLLCLSSCSTYYINTLSSRNTIRDEKTGEFLVENDSVKIFYGFAGENAPVHIRVHNKLAVPVFIDWTRSSIIAKGKSKGLVPNDSKFSGNVSTTSWNNRPLSSAESSFHGSVQNPKEVAFIPPNSSVEATIKLFDADVFTGVADSLFKDKEVLSAYTGNVKAKAASFEYSNTPLSFRSYLTLYTQEGSNNNIFSFDREFYISKTIRTSSRPQSLILYSSPVGNIFYSSKATGYGSTMTGVGVAAVAAGAAALAPDKTEE